MQLKRHKSRRSPDPPLRPRNVRGLTEEISRHADILSVTGPVTVQGVERMRGIYALVLDPKMIMAIGSCAVSGEAYIESYAFVGPLDHIIHVDVYVPGCPPDLKPSSMGLPRP